MRSNSPFQKVSLVDVSCSHTELREGNPALSSYWPLQSELEDLCFAILHPDCYKKLHEERNKLWSLEPASIAAETGTPLEKVIPIPIQRTDEALAASQKFPATE